MWFFTRQIPKSQEYSGLSRIFSALMITLCSYSVLTAADLLRRGELVAIPTETVYGLAANALQPEAVVKIFEAKNRPFFDPLIVHLSGAGQLEKWALDIPESARQLARTCWPGPLTLVLPRGEHIPDLVTSGLDTAGFRVPDHPLTLELLTLLDFPLAAPSANPFGYISPTTAEHVMDQLNGRIGMVLDGGPCRVGLESTIVGFEFGKPVIYRLGGLTRERIEENVGPVELMLNQSGDPRSPGQLKSHYAPRVPLRLGDPVELSRELPGKRLGILAFQRIPEGEWQAGRVLSPGGDPAEAARNLFGMLRELDAESLDFILAERLPESGLGRAINDRLERAAG